MEPSDRPFSEVSDPPTPESLLDGKLPEDRDEPDTCQLNVLQNNTCHLNGDEVKCDLGNKCTCHSNQESMCHLNQECTCQNLSQKGKPVDTFSLTPSQSGKNKQDSTHNLGSTDLESKKTFDGLLIHHLGQFGRFQWFLFLSLAMSSVAATWHNLIHVFTGVTPDYQCASASDIYGFNVTSGGLTQIRGALSALSLGGSTWTTNVTDLVVNDNSGYSHTNGHYAANVTEHVPDQCTRLIDNGTAGGQAYTAACTRWTYDTTQYTSSIVTEWDLVCGDRWMPSFVQSMHMIGCLFGTLICGELSDRYGRRKTLLVTSLIVVVTGICTAFVPTFELYVILRFLTGMAISGQFNSAYIIAIELVGPKWRGIAGIMMLYLAAFGIMLMAGLAYLVRDWRRLQLVVSAPLALLLTYFLVAPESPRWLLVHKKMKGARKLIEKLAKYNGKELPENYRDWLNHEGQSHRETGRRYSIADLFRKEQIRTKSITLLFLWFAISVTYYGLSMYTSDLGGNDYLNFFLSGAVEVPAYTFSIWCLQRFGRRYSLSISMATAGVILLLTSAFGDDQPRVRIVLSMCGKMCISVAYVIIYPFSVELFPTVVRNSGLGVASTGARIGGFVAPYILLLGSVSKVIPLVVCGAVALSGGTIAIMLPETANMQLPETMEDAENIKNNSIIDIIRRLFRRLPKSEQENIIHEVEVVIETASDAGSCSDQTVKSGSRDAETDALLDKDPARAHAQNEDNDVTLPVTPPHSRHATNGDLSSSSPRSPDNEPVIGV